MRALFLAAVLFLALQISHGPPASALPVQGVPARRKIALLHMYDGVWFFGRLGKLTGENKRRYAARFGYDFVRVRQGDSSEGVLVKATCGESESSAPDEDGNCWRNDPTFDIDHRRAPTFGKILLALSACQGRKNAWLLWSDADAMIVNQTIPLESVIDDAYDLIFAYDWLMLNAGVLLIKCSDWSKAFLRKVYDARKFDRARALDQSSFQEHLDKLPRSELNEHVKVVPKHAINVYLEEYRPGDFLIHMAGKLYEATESGLWAIANQFDLLSTIDDVKDISAFFTTRRLLGYYSGTCKVRWGQRQHSCKPLDPRRILLNETLGSMSMPNRYRHVGLRYYWLGNWKDKYDVPGWDVFKKPLKPSRDLIKYPLTVPPPMAPEKEILQQAPLKDAPLKAGNVHKGDFIADNVQQKGEDARKDHEVADPIAHGDNRKTDQDNSNSVTGAIKDEGNGDPGTERIEASRQQPWRRGPFIGLFVTCLIIVCVFSLRKRKRSSLKVH